MYTNNIMYIGYDKISKFFVFYFLKKYPTIFYVHHNIHIIYYNKLSYDIMDTASLVYMRRLSVGHSTRFALTCILYIVKHLKA